MIWAGRMISAVIVRGVGVGVAKGWAQAHGARAKSTRIAMTIGLWVVLDAVPWIAANALAPAYHDGDPYWRLLVHDSVPLVGGVVTLVVLLPFLRSVSYRRRDVFLLMVPGYGLYFSWLVCWRLSFLPFVDWRAPGPVASGNAHGVP
jgi:hypothetical protein